jgi:ankyrin repeat protein
MATAKETDQEKLDTKLIDAAESGGLWLVHELLGQGANPMAKHPTTGETALMAAAAAGHLRCLGCLIGVSDPLAKSVFEEKTALMIAAENNEAACVQALLEAGGVDEQDARGETAFMRALGAISHECEDILSKVSDLSVANHEGKDALMIAIEKTSRMGQTSKLWADELLDRGAPIQKTKDGSTPLMIASLSAKTSLVRRLLPLSDPRETNDKGQTALMGAAASGNEELTRLLAPLSDARARDKEGKQAIDLLDEWGLGGAEEDRARVFLLEEMSRQEAAEIMAAVFEPDANARENGGAAEAGAASAADASGQGKSLARRAPRAL